jgi:hypothetical protein
MFRKTGLGRAGRNAAIGGGGPEWNLATNRNAFLLFRF